MKLNEQQIDDFYKNFGSDHLQMQTKILGEYGKSLIDIYYKSLSFIVQVLVLIGVIAGFGFTAYSFVESKSLFFVGESILIGTIIYGILWIQRIYIGEYKALREDMDKFVGFFERRNAHFFLMHTDLISKNEVNETDLRKLLEIDNEMLVIFKPKTLPNADGVHLYPTRLFSLLVTGVFCMFSSFTFNSVISYIEYCLLI